jgi:hypothetical protein
MGNRAQGREDTLCSTYAPLDSAHAVANLNNAYFKSGITQLTDNESMAPQVGCSVYNCQYNRGDMCNADAISIDGEHAVTNESTCCKTFTPKA